MTDEATLLREIESHTFFGVVVTGKDLETIIHFSPGAEKIFGISAEQVIGKSVKDLYKNPQEREGLIERLRKEGEFTYESHFKKNKGTPDEEVIDIIFSLKMMYDKDGREIGTLGMVRDITYKRENDEKEKENLMTLIYALQLAVENYDKYTRNHTLMVAYYCDKIGFELKKLEKYKDLDRDLLSRAVSLHDIGKIGIEREMMLSRKRFHEGDHEKKSIQMHTEKGNEYAELFGLPHEIGQVALLHHERWDGNGYYGKKGEETPLYARIVAIADCYDAMTTGRPYKKKMTKEEAIEELKRCSGMDFDRKKIASYNRRAFLKATVKDAKCLFSLRPGKFIERLRKNSKTYFVDRMQKELQFDPEIAGVFIKYLETTKEKPPVYEKN